MKYFEIFVLSLLLLSSGCYSDKKNNTSLSEEKGNYNLDSIHILSNLKEADEFDFEKLERKIQISDSIVFQVLGPDFKLDPRDSTLLKMLQILNQKKLEIERKELLYHYDLVEDDINNLDSILALLENRDSVMNQNSNNTDSLIFKN